MMRKKALLLLTSIFIATSPITVLAEDINTFELSTYKKGMESEDIKLIQKALKKAGIYNHDEITSYYGEITKNAVKNFQLKYNLDADGVAGKSTLEKMEELGLFTYGNLTLPFYEKDIHHEDVKILQKALREEGFYNNDFETTYFGPDTEEAVRRFQKKYDLYVDGIVGHSTIDKMVALGLVTNNKRANGVNNKFIGSLSLTIYEKGMKHPEVKIIQQALKKCVDFNEDFTTYYGSTTEKAVKDFQKKYKLKADGVVGSSTIEKMKELGLVTYKVSRGNVKRGYGEYLDWWKQVKKMLKRNKTILTIQDLETGLKFKVKYTAGSNHADVEALSKKDTSIIKKIWGGFSWERRPVLVALNGRRIAASMTAMPHAGVEGKTGGKYVSGRSGGYGYGYNFDFIKGNGMSGHIDLHFKNSQRHKDDKKDPKHQAAIKRAAGLK